MEIIPHPLEDILIKLPKTEYKINMENNVLYNLKIFKGENTIILMVIEDRGMTKILYKNEVSIQEFYSYNRIFRQYISIEEIFNMYFKTLKQSEIIIRKDNNKIKICFLIEFRDKKDEVPFILEPEESKIEEIIINLYEKVKEIDILKKEIKEQKELNKKKQKEFDIYKKNIEDKINNILNNINNDKYKKKNNKIIELESKLIDKENIINNLKNKINTIEKENKELKQKIDELEIIKNKFKDKEKIDSNIIKENELSLIEEGIKNKFNKKIK